MMNKLSRYYPFALVTLLLLSGCQKGNDNPGYTSERQPNDAVEQFPINIGNARNYKEDYFNNPNNIYRVLPVTHKLKSGTGPNISHIDEVMEMGYGGITTSVNWGENYLNDDYSWQLMSEALEYGFSNYDMKTIIYDEMYYPSGGARHNTLDNLAKTDPNGTYDAQGLVHRVVSISSGGRITLPSLYGHKLVHACPYSSSSLETLTDSVVSSAPDLIAQGYKEGDSWTSSVSGILVCLFQKSWYEGTHYQNNLMQSRKYVDLLNEKTIQEFLRNTYDNYYNRYQNYFGSNIISFFFDEPSLPGVYFAEEDTQPTIVDPIDPNIEKRPAINYDAGIVDKFKSKYGYDPTPYLSLIHI